MPGRSTPTVVLLVNAEYEAKKFDGQNVSISRIERQWGLKAGQLRYFRANRKRRKSNLINLVHT